MLGLECSTICSRGVDGDADRQTDRGLEAFEIWIWRRMDKVIALDNVTNEEVLRSRVNEDSQILNSTL